MGNITSNFKSTNIGFKKVSKQIIMKNKSEDTTDNNANHDVYNLVNEPKQQNGVLSFTKGGKLEVVGKNNTDVWAIKRLDTGETGCIPSNYVTTNDFESEDWYYGCIGYSDAEKLLIYGEYPIGTYMIRLSEHNTPNTLKSYVLSIKCIDYNNPNRHIVKHYRIRETPSGNFRIGNREFPTLPDIIKFYSTDSGWLCSSLVQPCLKNQANISAVEIDRNDIKLIRHLGIGSFGTVFHGIFFGQTEVAVKILKPGKISLQVLLKESVIMKRCTHEKLVKWFGVFSREEPFLIITEFVKNGSLLEYLRDSEKEKTLKLQDLIDMCAQVASGMSYLESIKLIHKNLAARNILVGDNNEVKVSDFGLARITEDMAQKETKYSVKWTAPEAALFGMFTTESDVWSYGVLLFEVITRGQVPFPGMGGRDFREQVYQYKYRMPKPLGVECPDYFYEMMLKCWDEIPNKRPTFEYLYKFFDDYFVATEPFYLE